MNPSLSGKDSALMRMSPLPAILRVCMTLTLVLVGLTSLPSTAIAQSQPFYIDDGDVDGLIDAIRQANADYLADTIVLAEGGTYILSEPIDEASVLGPSGLPIIYFPLTIIGNGATIMRSTAADTPEFRILHIDDDVTLDNVTISNGLSQFGGGLINRDRLTITNSTISGNMGVEGGGINTNADATLVMINSTVSGNTALAGGGILNWNQTTLINSTVSDNHATQLGSGGVFNAAPLPGLHDGGDLTAINTIIAGNTSGDDFPDVLGPVSGSHNLIGDGTGMSGLSDGVDGNQVGTAANPINALLGSLDDNGGPTQTMALLDGSPAIDAGDTAAGPDTDQRGISRPQFGVSDIGAYEWADTTPPSITSITSGIPNAEGWYADTVVVQWHIHEPDSPITSTTGCDAVTFATDTTGETLTCIATSTGGTDTQSVTVKRDATPPVITYTGNEGHYGPLDTISITCEAVDSTSGIASDTCEDVTGTGADIGFGQHDFSATATDNAGNTASGSTSFVVGVSHADLCTLTQQFVRQPAWARSACMTLAIAQMAERVGNPLLERAALTGYRLQIHIAIASRMVTPSNGQHLIDWSNTLQVGPATDNSMRGDRNRTSVRLLSPLTISLQTATLPLNRI